MSPSSGGPLMKLHFLNVVKTYDLFWAFRGTQGIKVSGGVTVGRGKYTGSVTYTIYDTAGFKGNDTSALSPFIDAAHYLQTVCGQPKYANGPHWFTVTLTVTVPFLYPAAS